MNTTMLSKEESLMFPKIFTIRHFKPGSDTRDNWNEVYAYEKIANNKLEEVRVYENLNHELNLVIEIKLPNGVIK
jgi:hypothetical protein